MNFRQVEASFKSTLGNIFPEVDQRVIQTIWRVDNLPKIAHQVNSFKVAEEVIRYRDHIAHLDHLII